MVTCRLNLTYMLTSILVTFSFSLLQKFYMGGCQNYGPFVAPYYSTASNI